MTATQRAFDCPETGERCNEGRCRRDLCILQKEERQRERAAKRMAAVARAARIDEQAMSWAARILSRNDPGFKRLPEQERWKRCKARLMKQPEIHKEAEEFIDEIDRIFLGSSTKRRGKGNSN